MNFDEEVYAFLKRGRGRVPREYLEYQIMRHMGWTYQELQQCPAEVVQNIIRFMNTEARYHQQELERMKGEVRRA